MTINNLNKFVVRRLKIRHCQAKAQFRLRRELSRTIRPINPSLKAGVSGYTSYRALAPMAQQHEVVHVIYCQSLRGWSELLQLLATMQTGFHNNREKN